MESQGNLLDTREQYGNSREKPKRRIILIRDTKYSQARNSSELIISKNIISSCAETFG